jgi:hypothetical protein
MHREDDNKTSRRIRRLLHLTILGATGALLIQTSRVAGEGVAARSDGARAVEAGRRSDHAAARPSHAALKRRMDEMRERRRGHRLQREEKLRRLSPEERRRRLGPKPFPRRPRHLDDTLERVDTLRRRLGAPTIAVRR